jgi:hypothetical protein
MLLCTRRGEDLNCWSASAWILGVQFLMKAPRLNAVSFLGSQLWLWIHWRQRHTPAASPVNISSTETGQEDTHPALCCLLHTDTQASLSCKRHHCWKRWDCRDTNTNQRHMSKSLRYLRLNQMLLSPTFYSQPIIFLALFPDVMLI